MNEGERKAVILGGSGYLGRLLAPWLASRGWAVVVLSRRETDRIEGARLSAWDGETLGDWAQEVEGAAAVVNLAGRSVNCRYTPHHRREILESRVKSTRVVGQAIAACHTPPPVWLNASTATIYRHSLDRAMDDATGEIAATPEARDAFSIEVATAWERTLAEATTPATRKVALRTAMVLAPGQGGVYEVLHRLVHLRLGGRMGRGDQFGSWGPVADFCAAVEGRMAHDLSGPVNVAAPHPVTNRDLMALLRWLCGVRVGLPATRWMLEIGAFFLRTETELVLKSRRVVPTQLLQNGFRFCFPDIESALADLHRRGRDADPGESATNTS